MTKGRLKRKAQYRMDQHVGHKPDPLVRVIAAHEQLVVAAVGPSIRVLNCT